jgi:hypothetical protein
MHLSREPGAPVATGALYLCGVQRPQRIIYTSRQPRDMYLSMIREGSIAKRVLKEERKVENTWAHNRL